MIISNKPGHVACLYEDADVFFELGYKVLDKQRLDMTIPGIKVLFNGMVQMMYDVENARPLAMELQKMTREEILFVIDAVEQIQAKIEHNGFITREAILLDENHIFWNVQLHRIQFIVLPVTGECSIQGLPSWEIRYQQLMEYLKERRDTLPQNPDGENRLMQETEPQPQQAELSLHYDEIYGQFSLYVRKQEFLIGKKRDSVDGYIGVSNAISRVHCKIEMWNAQYYVTDLDSVNHTYVNGIMLQRAEQHLLQHGDILRIADINLHVRIQ